MGISNDFWFINMLVHKYLQNFESLNDISKTF